MRLLENEDLQRMVDYSFGDHSGVLGGVPNAFMEKANESNIDFRKKVVDSEKPVMTLFIDNIRLYRRPLNYSDWMHQKWIPLDDYKWLDQFKDEDLLDLISKPPFDRKSFIIFTAFEDTPLDEYIWDRIPRNVISINAANAVIFGGKIVPWPHGIERIMYPGYNHHEILQSWIDPTLYGVRVYVKPSSLLFVAHRADTGARASIGDLFKDKNWATVTHLPYEEYLKGISEHKFVLCPSGNGIESARNWETLYMRRVPIFKRHPYLEEMFKDFPALFVNEFEEVTADLLMSHDHLYQQAQTMSMDGLDLDKVFESRL